MQNKGYTVPELFVVIVIVGIFSMLAINKVSYAFLDSDKTSDETRDLVITKVASVYAETIKETLKENEIYITGKDLVDAGFLVDDDHTFTNIKLKLSYNKETNSPHIEILK